MPKEYRIAGAFGEKNVNEIPFSVKKENGTEDMSEFTFFIDYANGDMRGRHTVKDLSFDEDEGTIHFKWILTNRALSEKGHLWFSVSAEKTSSDCSKIYKTQPESLTVLDAVQYDEDRDTDDDSPIVELTALVKRLEYEIENWGVPTASRDEIGGIRLGGSLTMDENGVVNVIPERELTINEIDAICV